MKGLELVKNFRKVGIYYMKKLFTMAFAMAMTVASASLAVADDAEPIAAITNAYTFENAYQDESVVDKWVNPFKNLGLDTATIQYTVTIPSAPKYLTGYDTVMTFGTKNAGFLYICNELVGMNSGGSFVDYWPSGTTGKMVYPGRGSSYTVNLVFAQEGVSFYVDGELQPGSNISAANGDGEAGTLTGADMLNMLNTQSTLYFGDDTTISYWAEQDMTLTNIVFFKGAVTTPYTLQGTESKPARVGQNGEEVTEATTQAPTEAPTVSTTVAPASVDEGSGDSITLIMIVVVVVIVAVIGVAAMVILSQKRR